jgi:hypothetical protein
MYDVISWIFGKNGTLAHIALVWFTPGAPRSQASVETAVETISKRTARPLRLYFAALPKQTLRRGALVRFAGKTSNESFMRASSYRSLLYFSADCEQALRSQRTTFLLCAVTHRLAR